MWYDIVRCEKLVEEMPLGVSAIDGRFIDDRVFFEN